MEGPENIENKDIVVMVENEAEPCMLHSSKLSERVEGKLQTGLLCSQINDAPAVLIFSVTL